MAVVAFGATPCRVVIPAKAGIQAALAERGCVERETDDGNERETGA